MAWNCWGEDNYVWFHSNRMLSSFATFVSPWYMALLFVLAGISARLALRKKTNREFIRERISKLLIPLIAGICSIVALMAYYADKFHNGYQGNFFTHYSVFFTKYTDLTGYDGGWSPGHLWFLMYLFVISMICLLLIGLQKRLMPGFSFGTMSFLGLVGLVLLFPCASMLLNIGGKSIGLYMLLYLIGYYIIVEDNVMEKIVKYRCMCLLIFIVSDVADVYLFIWADHANEILNTITMYFTCWFGILTLLGYAKSYFNQNNRLTQYLTKRSFLIYIFNFLFYDLSSPAEGVCLTLV